MKKKLKIGLLVNSYWVSTIDFNMLKQICNSDFAEISLIIKNEGRFWKEFDKTARKGLKKLLGANYILVVKFFFIRILKLYLSKREVKYFKVNSSSQVALNNELLKDVPVVKVMPRQTKYRDYFRDKDIDKISTYNIDVFIRFGFRILSGRVLKSAKYGIWSFHHGDNEYKRGGPAGFWEFYERQEKTVQFCKYSRKI